MPTTREQPDMYWTDMSDAAFTAENAPWSSGWLMALVRNTEYLKQALYGSGSYTGDVPHSHTTGEDQHASPVIGVNYVRSSCPNFAGSNDEGNYKEWRLRGFEIGRNAAGTKLNWITGQLRGDHFYQGLFARVDYYDATASGAGRDYVVSLWARAVETPTQGELLFGLADREKDDRSLLERREEEGALGGSLLVGQRGLLHYTDLTTSWQRFYMRVKRREGYTYTAPRYLGYITQDFDAAVEITALTVTFGRQLYPWSPCPADPPVTLSNATQVGSNAGWQNCRTGAPLMEWASAIDNAVELEPF